MTAQPNLELGAITLNQMATFLPKFIASRLNVFIKGSPGIGKSAIAKQVAAKLNLELIDIRLAECDPTDLQGFPYFDQETKKASYFPLNTFPTTNDVIPAGKDGWLIFLDEFSNAPLSVQAAAYKLVLDRQVGQHKLHDKVAIIAAGNREDDNAAAQPMSSALVSRFAMFNVEVNQQEWNDWAIASDIDYRITAYLNFRPDHLYTFNPRTSEQPYACPRTWAMLDTLMKKAQNSPDTNITHEITVLGSLIGVGVASEFLGYLKLQDKMHSFESIIANPEKIELSNDLSIRWALQGMIGSRVTAETFPQAITFLKRFNSDLQVVAMREIVTRHRSTGLLNAPEFQAWRLELSKVLA